MKNVNVNQLLTILVLFSSLFLFGCIPEDPGESSSDDSSSSGSTAMELKIGFPVSGSRFLKKVALGSFSDVVSVKVDVSDDAGDFSQEVLLTKNEDIWSAEINDFPTDRLLTFKAEALNSSSEVIFFGSQTQKLTGSGDSVIIAMRAVDDGEPSALPKIISIEKAERVGISFDSDIIFAFGGTAGETLNYEVILGTSLGSFNPATGNVLLLSDSRKVTLTYTAPSVEGTYTYAIKVKNDSNYWVQIYFNITVVSGIPEGEIKTKFYPTVVSLGGILLGDNIEWWVTAEDDGPLSELQYVWSIDNDSMSFPEPEKNPGILTKYSSEKSGWVTVEITDKDGLKTTASVYLEKEQFGAGEKPSSSTFSFETGQIPSFLEFLSGKKWGIEYGQGAYETDLSLTSGHIGDNEKSCFSFSTTTSKEGNISFYRKVSSEKDRDFLYFYLNGDKVGEWSGSEEDWSLESYPLNIGTHEFEFCFDKDETVDVGEDKAWIDQIVLPYRDDEPTSYPGYISLDFEEEEIPPFLKPGSWGISSSLKIKGKQSFITTKTSCFSFTAKTSAGELTYYTYSTIFGSTYGITFSIDGETKKRSGGAWSQNLETIEAGIHEFSWCFQLKSGYGATGAIDAISIPFNGTF